MEWIPGEFAMWAADAEQSCVIGYNGNRLLVVGGAGSGKTVSLARRALRLVNDGVPPQSILVISAEGSGRAALREALGHCPGLRVETPSSYAARLLKNAGQETRILTRFQEFLVLQESLSANAAGKAVWPFGPGVGVVQAIQEGLDAVRRGSKILLPDSPLRPLVAELDRHYAREACVPYTALACEATRLRSSNQETQFDIAAHLLVDGFEHMHPAERELVLGIQPEETAVICSADEEEGMPEPIDRCRLKTIHRFLPTEGCPGQAVYWQFEDSAEEASGVAAVIARLIHSGVDPREILVLYRDYLSSGGDLETALRFSGIPHEVQGGRPLVRGTGARLVAHYFESLAEPEDEDALYRWLSSPLVGLDLMALGRMRRGARNSGVPLERFMRERGALWPGLDRLPGLLAVRTSHLESQTVPSLLRTAGELIKSAGALGRLLSGGAATGSRNDEELHQLAQFLRMVEEFDEGIGRPAATLSEHAGTFMEVCTSFWGGSASPYSDIPVVRLMGVHQARGLEAQIVFLCGAAAGNFPGNAQEGVLDGALGLRPKPGWRTTGEAEEALFEVGVTRGRRSLYVSYAARSGRVECEPSPLATRRFGKPQPFERPEAAAPDGGSAFETDIGQDAAMGGRPFSHSGIRDFLACPRRYFFAHVLRIQGDQPSGASLGSLVHDTLAAFHKRHDDLGRVHPEQAAASMDELLAETAEIYKRDFGPPLVAESIRRNAQELLNGYLDNVAFPCWGERRVDSLEREFELRFVERRIRGRIDRADRLPDESLELIDYKTSPYDQAATLGLKRQFLNVDDKEDYQPSDFQLPLYYLALNGHERVSRLSYYQLAGGNARTFDVDPGTADRSSPREARITGGDLDRIRESLAAVLENMEKGHFSPQPRSGQNCRSCPYTWACAPELEDGAEEGETP